MSPEIRCVRCQGRKKLYKINNGYSYLNTGGVLVNCPMCLGTGHTKSTQEIIDVIDEIAKRSTQVAEKETAICHECLGENGENYEVYPLNNQPEKLKDKRKSAKDAEKQPEI